MSETRQYDKCPTCGRWAWLDKHTCPPPWECYDPDNSEPDYADTLYGYDGREVAELYFEQNDSEYDYPDEMTVCVRPSGSDAAWEKYEVEAEAVRQYNATKVE